MAKKSEENYYELLEVLETANPDEIKKAYRKLSLKYHPDRNGGNLEYSEKFKKINMAYETLSDSERKHEYDNRNNNDFQNHVFSGNDINELFNNLFFGGVGRGNGVGGMQFMNGIPTGPMGMGMDGFPTGNIHIFRNGVQINTNPFQKPTPIIKNIIIPIEQVLTGTTLPIEIDRWIIQNDEKILEKQTLYVNIPKGIDDNEIIVIPNQGNVTNETCKGDIKVFVNIENKTEFVRNGLDLILEKQISLKNALCGFSFEMKYINGKSYTIHNNAGTIIHPGYKKIIPSMGLVRENHTGSLIIQFKVQFPEKLTAEQSMKLSEIL